MPLAYCVLMEGAPSGCQCPQRDPAPLSSVKTGLCLPGAPLQAGEGATQLWPFFVVIFCAAL